MSLEISQVQVQSDAIETASVKFLHTYGLFSLQGFVAITEPLAILNYPRNLQWLGYSLIKGWLISSIKMLEVLIA